MNESKGNATIPVLIIVILLAVGAYYTWQKATEKPPIVIGGDATTTDQNLKNCTIVVNATTTLYTRPNKESDEFGQITPVDVGVIAGGKTLDGWIGFEPGVAQAPNVGPFRLRYIPPNSSVTLVGNCNALPVVPNLSPKQCFVMTQVDIPIYKDATSTSPVVATMHFGDYIEAVGKKGKSSNLFYKVASTFGSLASGTVGYVSSATVDFNGACNLKTLK